MPEFFFVELPCFAAWNMRFSTAGPSSCVARNQDRSTEGGAMALTLRYHNSFIDVEDGSSAVHFLRSKSLPDLEKLSKVLADFE